MKEREYFNSLLIKNNVTTIASDNILIWLNHWFKIFRRKAAIFLKNSERILGEIEDDWKKYEQYVSTIPNDGKIIDYFSLY